MKKVLLTVIFVFSLVLNAATVATLGWHLWMERRSVPPGTNGNAPLARQDVQDIYRLWPDGSRVSMGELKGKIREKRAEVLDAIAANPGNPQAADKSIRELTALRDQMERQALAGISAVMAQLPPEKRDAFLSFLKNRPRMGPGMGMGHGRRMRRDHRGGPPPCQTTETPATPRDQP